MTYQCLTVASKNLTCTTCHLPQGRTRRIHNLVRVVSARTHQSEAPRKIEPEDTRYAATAGTAGFQNYGYSQYAGQLSLTGMNMGKALGSDAG
jgi:hypothetical protein